MIGILGRSDDEYLADAGHHQRAERVVHHRLVVDGHELFANAFGDGVEAGAGSAS